MLNTPAAFPYPGSWAIFEGAAITVAVRILSTEAEDGTVKVSVAGAIGASGNQNVPMSALRDPTPLNRAEKDTLTRLECELIGYTGRGNADSRRAEALRSRMIHAELLRGMLARIPAKASQAALVARRQLDTAA